MDTLDKYLVKEYLTFFAMMLAMFGVLYLAIDFLTNFWNVQMPLSQVAALYFYKLPAAFQLLTPVACLASTLLVFSHMSRTNEVLALSAGGIGWARVLSTVVATVACVSTITFLTFDPLVPAFRKREIMTQKGVDPSQEVAQLFGKTGIWTRSGGVIYHVGRFNPEQNLLEDISLFSLSPDFFVSEKLFAKRARFYLNEWTLEDGFTLRRPSDSKFPFTETFETRSGVLNEKPTDFKTLRVNEELMRLKDLRKYIKRNSSFGLDTTAQQVFYHDRVAKVFAPLILVLLGFPFAFKPLKTQSTATSIAFCFLVVSLYLLLSNMTVNIGKAGHIPPFIAGWTPNLVFLTVAFYRLGKT